MWGLLPHRSLVQLPHADDDACPGPRLCTEHFDLTADDSQDEGLADGMHSCELACTCRTATPHRVMIGCSARRWPVRRRGTRDVRDTRRTGLQRAGRCKSRARRRTRSANCAFSEMEHVGSFYICSICKILLLPSASDGVRDLRGGSGDEWLGQPHPPCTKSDPTWSAEEWRWGGEVGGEKGRPPPHRVGGALWRRRSQGSHGRATDGRTTLMVERSGSRVSSRGSAYSA